MAHKKPSRGEHRSLRTHGVLLAIFGISVAIIGILAIDYFTDGQSDVLQSIGIEEPPLGPENLASPENAPEAVAGEDVEVSGDSAHDYSADTEGQPVSGMDGVDLSTISPGGGLAPEEHDWSTMRPSEVAIPEANLVIPFVPRGLISLDSSTQEMDLPVSFQAGWLTSSSPLGTENGTTVMAGHVNWADGSWAPMSNLYNATPGMTVLTSDDGGTVQEWTVTHSNSVPQNELSQLFSLTDTKGPRKLVLITCEASVDDHGNIVFDQNHVVTAVPQN